MLVLREPWISSYSWSVMSILSFEYCLSSGGDSPSFFFVIFVGGVCLSIYYTCLSSVYFGCAGSVGVFLACRVIFLSAWSSAVWSVGPIQFFEH